MSHSEAGPAAAPHPLERRTAQFRAAIRALPTLPFVLGLVLGFGACVLAGRLASERLLFQSFVRFFQPIQPQQYFYPTASQLIAHVRHTVPPGRIPVIVGGASYFRGTGQNARELWTLELQRLLGDRYCVINFAIDQAHFTSFAAVAFAALAHEYPDLLYVANGSPLAGAPWDGGEVYQYVFWDAYYKGLLPASVSEAATTQQLARAQRRTADGLELHAGRWLDRFTYACDLWTSIGYEHFFTVWTDSHAEAPFQPRRRDRDGEVTNYAEQQLRLRTDHDYRANAARHGRQAARLGFRVPAGGGPAEPDPAFWQRISEEWSRFFPAELRRRCLVVFLRGNPHFMQTLTADERRRTELQYELGRQSLERAGYQVVPLRAEEFSAADYLDGGHLMPSGGFKVARAIALHVEDWDRANETVRGPGRPPAGVLELSFSLPERRPARRETLLLLAGTDADTTERLAIEYAPGNQVRFVHTRGTETRFSPFVGLDAARTHALTLSTGALYPPVAGAAALKLPPAQLQRLKSWLLLRLNGRPFWEVPMPLRDAPRANLYVGKDPPTAVDGIQFSGTVQAVERRPAPPRLLPRDRVAGARLRLTLTAAMAGRSFPLAATGNTGDGDVLFLRVGPDGAVTLGYDHWATTAVLSPVIPFGVGVERTVEFQLPAVASDGGRKPLIVRVDGQEVWRRDVPFFPAGAHGVHFGANPIGASTAEPILEGAVFESVLIPTWEG